MSDTNPTVPSTGTQGDTQTWRPSPSGLSPEYDSFVRQDAGTPSFSAPATASTVTSPGVSDQTATGPIPGMTSPQHPVSPVSRPARAADAVPVAPVTQVSRRTRRARLRLSRIDPWSVMKTAFLFAIAGGIVFFVAVWVIWGVIGASGVFASVNKAVTDLVSSPSSPKEFRLEDYINTHKVLGFSAVVAAIDVVIFTALATLASFLYNLASTVMGGLEVTLAED